MKRMVVELIATISTSCGGAVGTKSTNTYNIYMEWVHREVWNVFLITVKEKKLLRLDCNAFIFSHSYFIYIILSVIFQYFCTEKVFFN